MGITAKAGAEIELIPEDVYLAVCHAVIDLGLQPDKTYGGHKHKIMIGWELPELTYTYEGKTKPKTMWNRYTLSLSAKSVLYGILTSWRGRKFTEAELKGFDISALLGAPCQLQVVHTSSGGKNYANVQNVMPLPKGTAKPQPTVKWLFSFEDGAVFPEGLPEWIVKTIKGSANYQHAEAPPESAQGSAEPEDDDQVPF